MGSSEDRYDRRRSSDDKHRKDDRSHRSRHSRSRSRSLGRRRSRSRSGSDGREGNHRHRRASPDERRSRRSTADDRYHDDRRHGDGRSDSHMHRGGGAAVLATEPPAVGSILRATVSSVRPFGVFVRPEGHPQDAMVHSGQVSEQLSLSREDPDDDKIKALEYFAPPRSQVWIKILEVSNDGTSRIRIGASMKVVDQDTGQDLDPSNVAAARPTRMQRGPESDEPPEVGTIHEATVERVQPYGIFVRLRGFRKFGLVHSSQVSDHLELSREDSDEDKVAALSSVVAVGEQVHVKVVDVQQDERGPKVGCSIKLVNQRDGTDLDPNFVKYRPRREEGGGGRQGPVGSSAAQVVGAKIDWGHLTGGDTHYGNASTYDLVADDAGDLPSAPSHMPGQVCASQRETPSQPGPPLGRGRAMVQPAWMTAGTAAAAAPGRPREWGAINSVEEALQILEKAGKTPKNKDKKKKDKDRKEKHKRHKVKTDKKKHKD